MQLPENYINLNELLDENSLKYYRDIKNVVDTAYEDGKMEVAKNLKRMGFSVEQIIEATGLSREEIEKL